MIKADERWFQETIAKMDDFIQASMTYVILYAEDKYVKASETEQLYAEHRYHTQQQRRVILGMVREAAHRAGITLTGYTENSIPVERITEQPTGLVSFERFMEDLT